MCCVVVGGFDLDGDIGLVIFGYGNVWDGDGYCVCGGG